MANRLTPILITIFLSLVVAAETPGAGAVIRQVGYSPQQARDLGLPIHRAMPLKVIGVGQPVYLESAYEGTYSWSLAAPEGSSSALSSRAGREVCLIPDTAGSYTVTLGYTDSLGAVSFDETTITSGTYIGVEPVTGDISFEQCALCHPDKKATWEQTIHADILQRGLNGTSSIYYGQSCIQCHTVGYDTLAVNNGFDDRAATEGWSLPETLGEGVYDEFADSFPYTAQMAGIQCECCHGPGSGHMGVGPIGLSYDAGVCAYCHDEHEASQCGCKIHETYFYTEQWRHSGHGNILSSPEADFNTAGNDCVRCHTAEGFFEVNVREGHQATSPYKSPHGITCAVCHDPHDATGSHQLRLAGDYLSLDESGVAVYKTEGTAATACDICHHLHPGTDMPGSIPHYSPQADVLDNRAGYRYPGKEYPESNIHGTEIQTRCAGCHMSYAPLEKKTYVGRHTFAMHAEADSVSGPPGDLYLTEACIGCHGSIGEDFDFRGVQTRVTRLLEAIKERLVLFGQDAPAELRGNPRYSQEDLDAGIITEQQKNAAYNWYVFYRDGSKGIHNPALAVEILEDALEDLGGPGPGQWCDFNRNGSINITDVIALLLFLRTDPGDPRGDFNGDGSADITDAIAMLLAILNGICPDAGVLK